MEIKLTIDKKYLSNLPILPKFAFPSPTKHKDTSSQDISFSPSKASIKGELEISLENFLKEQDVTIDLENILSALNKNLKIEFDDILKIPIYKIIDATNKEILKQIPLEEILEFKRALYEYLKRNLGNKAQVKGIILDKEV